MKNMLKMTFVTLFMLALAADLKGVKGPSWNELGIESDVRTPAITFIVVVYFIVGLAPSLIAAYRNHQHQWAILMLNLVSIGLPFLAPEAHIASLIGWAGAFVWVAMPVTKTHPPKAVAL